MKTICLTFCVMPVLLAASTNDIKIHCKEKLDNLYYLRFQMDCWTERIDGKIEAYLEFLEYLERKND